MLPPADASPGAQGNAGGAQGNAGKGQDQGGGGAPVWGSQTSEWYTSLTTALVCESRPVTEAARQAATLLKEAEQRAADLQAELDRVRVTHECKDARDEWKVCHHLQCCLSPV